MEELETFNNFAEEDVKKFEDEDNNEEDNATGIEEFDGNFDGNGEKNTNTFIVSIEWLWFIIPKSRTEALGAMAKAKACLLRYSRKKSKTSKSMTKIAHKGKAALNCLKKSPKIAGIKIEGLFGFQQPQPLRRIGRLQQAHLIINHHQIIPP